MATLPELEQALVKADAAGNTEDAKALADAIRAMRSSGDTAQVSPKVDINSPDYPTITAAPERTLAQKVRRGLANIGLMGRTEEQEMERNATLQQLGNISPALGSAVENAPQTAGQGLENAGGVVGVLKAPVNMAGEMGVEGLSVAGAQAVGGATGPFAPVAVPAFGAIAGAGSNALVQGKRMLLGQQKDFNRGEMAASTITGSIPGASLAKAGVKLLIKDAAKNVIANNIALATQNAMDGDPEYQRLMGISQKAAQAGDADTAKSFADQASNYRFKQHAIATAAGLGGTVLSKYLDKGSNKMVKLAEKEAKACSTELELVQKLQAEGFKLPPNILNKENKGLVGKINQMMASAAGPSDTTEAMMIRNEKLQQEVIRKQIYETPYGKQVAAKMGLDTSTPLTDKILDQIKDAANEPYNKLSLMAEKAAQDEKDLKKSIFLASEGDRRLEEIKLADTANAQKLRELQTKAGADIKQYLAEKYRLDTLYDIRRKKADPEVLEKIASQTDVVKNLEKKIDDGIQEMGMPDLFNEIKEARKLQAQVHEIRDAMTGGVHVDATSIANSPAAFSGNLKLIADFQNNFGKYLGDAAGRKPVDTSRISKFLTGAVGGSVGYMTHGGAGVAPGIAAGYLIGESIPSLIKTPAREISLSNFYQKHMTQPYYGYTMPDFNARAAKYMTMEAGRRKENQ